MSCKKRENASAWSLSSGGGRASLSERKKSLIEIDGGQGEGGGQILRTALCLSALMGESVWIFNVRKGRKRPGLRAQHLAAVRAVAAISDGRLEGAELGSTEVGFQPQRIRGGRYRFDVAEEQTSAGATGLIFQCIAPLLLFADSPSSVSIRGGTHTAWSPPFHYLSEVFWPMVSEFGAQGKLSLEQWGWYPRGGGKAAIWVEPVERLKAVQWAERGALLELKGFSAVSNLSPSIAKRQRHRSLTRLRGALTSLQVEAKAQALARSGSGFGRTVSTLSEEGPRNGQEGHFDGEPEIQVLFPPANGPGTCLFLLAGYERSVAGFCAIGERGKTAEQVADEATSAFLAHHRTGAALDPYLADQAVLYAALAEGETIFKTSRITPHLLTQIWITEKILPVEFVIKGKEGKPGTIGVRGIKYQRSF